MKIYSNFQDNEFAEQPFRSAQWGENHFDRQSNWNSFVAQEVASIVDQGDIIASAQDNLDSRPKLFDRRSGRYILVDSGASKSIWPVSDFEGRHYLKTHIITFRQFSASYLI